MWVDRHQIIRSKFDYDPIIWLGEFTMEDALHEKDLLSFFKENPIVATHLIQTNNLIVEIDADVLDAAFYFLKE